MTDKEIEVCPFYYQLMLQGTIVRTSTIPEELGRISYLLSDKTGTLTQNGKFKFLAVFANVNRDDIQETSPWIEYVHSRDSR